MRREARRHGHARALMEAIERVIRGAYELGALGASDMALAFYRGRGWLPWEGEDLRADPSGIERTPDDDDSLHVLESRRAAGPPRADHLRLARRQHLVGASSHDGHPERPPGRTTCAAP